MMSGLHKKNVVDTRGHCKCWSQNANVEVRMQMLKSECDCWSQNANSDFSSSGQHYMLLYPRCDWLYYYLDSHMTRRENRNPVISQCNAPWILSGVHALRRPEILARASDVNARRRRVLIHKVDHGGMHVRASRHPDSAHLLCRESIGIWILMQTITSHAVRSGDRQLHVSVQVNANLRCNARSPSIRESVWMYCRIIHSQR